MSSLLHFYPKAKSRVMWPHSIQGHCQTFVDLAVRLIAEGEVCVDLGHGAFPFPTPPYSTTGPPRRLQNPSDESAHHRRYLDCLLRFTWGRICARIAHLDCVYCQSIKRALIRWDDNAVAEAQGAQGCQVMNSRKHLASGHKEHLKVCLCALLGVKSGPVDQKGPMPQS